MYSNEMFLLSILHNCIPRFLPEDSKLPVQLTVWNWNWKANSEYRTLTFTPSLTLSSTSFSIFKSTAVFPSSKRRSLQNYHECKYLNLISVKSKENTKEIFLQNAHYHNKMILFLNKNPEPIRLLIEFEYYYFSLLKILLQDLLLEIYLKLVFVLIRNVSEVSCAINSYGLENFIFNLFIM